MNKSIKPPLGLIPMCIHHEERILSIQRAVNRYMESKLPIPEKWMLEYNALVKLF